MSISVLISTYGTDDWQTLAAERALPSVIDQASDIVCHHDPDGTIATTRNDAAAQTSADWLCCLDADDQLAPGFIREMERTINIISRRFDLNRTLLTPAVQYVRNGRPQRARFWPETNLKTGNWLVVGTLVPRSLFNEVGGFEDWPHGIEDWHLWAKCVKAGAAIVKVPRAVYVAHQNPESKHKLLQRDPVEYMSWYEKARRSVWGDEPVLPLAAANRQRRRA